MIADDLAFRTFDAASARFVYELAAMRRTVQACQKREMVAGWALTGSNLADVGLNSAKLAVTYVDGSSLVADHGFTTDHIGEKSFEKVLSPSVMKIGVAQGFGCNTDKPQDERDLTSTLDTFRHEIAAAYNVKGRGLVVLTSCSHRGVVNAIKQAQEASGVTKLHGLVGGFHLGPAPADYTKHIVSEILELKPDVVVPMHCSGEDFVEIMHEVAPDRLLLAASGAQLIFGA